MRLRYAGSCRQIRSLLKSIANSGELKVNDIYKLPIVEPVEAQVLVQ